MLLASFSPHADKTNIGSVQRIESVSTFWANRFLPCSHETARPHVDLQGPLRLLLDASLDGAISGHAPYVEQLSAFCGYIYAAITFYFSVQAATTANPVEKPILTAFDISGVFTFEPPRDLGEGDLRRNEQNPGWPRAS
jgi:hypothetical protein